MYSEHELQIVQMRSAIAYYFIYTQDETRVGAMILFGETHSRVIRTHAERTNRKENC